MSDEPPTMAEILLDVMAQRDEALRLLRRAVVIVDGQPEGRRLALDIDAFLAAHGGTLPLEGADT